MCFVRRSAVQSIGDPLLYPYTPLTFLTFLLILFFSYLYRYLNLPRRILLDRSSVLFAWISIMSHNVFTSPNYGDRNSNEIYDEKATVDMIDRVETAHTQGLTRMEAPELVRNMSPEERAHAEKILVRKIDFRLMPMLVIMYVRQGCRK